MDLKEKFKHITGMRPQFSTFESEDARMASEVTSKVIEKKIYKPAFTLITAQQGIENLAKWQQSNEKYLRQFRSPEEKRKAQEEAKQRWVDKQQRMRQLQRTDSDSLGGGSSFTQRESARSVSVHKGAARQLSLFKSGSHDDTNSVGSSLRREGTPKR